METINQYHFVAAATGARILLGILFFMQGYDGLMRIGFKNAAAAFRNEFSQKNVPDAFIVSAAFFSLTTAFVCGLLLIAGLFQYVALYMLSVNIIITAIGFGIINPVWDMRYVFPRAALVLFLLCIPPGMQVWSLDYLFINN